MYIPKIDRKTGEFRLSDRYKEIFVLRDKLEVAGIPFLMRRNMDGWQICYPTFDVESETHAECVCSCIEHYGSYGNEADKLEIMGLLTPEETEDDCVLGYLSADNVFTRIRLHYLTTEIERLKAELAAAIECIPKICGTCKYDSDDNSKGCKCCFGEGWEWRGLVKED